MSGEEILAQITAQGLVVRDLKVAKAEKDAITVEVSGTSLYVLCAKN